MTVAMRSVMFAVGIAASLPVLAQSERGGFSISQAIDLHREAREKGVQCFPGQQWGFYRQGHYDGLLGFNALYEAMHNRKLYCVDEKPLGSRDALFEAWIGKARDDLAAIKIQRGDSAVPPLMVFAAINLRC